MQRARRLLLLLAALALAVPARGQDAAGPTVEPSPAPPGPAIVESDGEHYITMDFQDVDIAVLVKFIGELTGKNFVMDERVQGKVTVVSPTRITPEEAYEVFQAVLQVKGFTTVPTGAAVRIIPTKDAKATSLRTLTDHGVLLPREEYITRLVPLAQVDVADVINVLQPLVAPDGLLTGYPETNSLIIVDSAANVSRLMQIVAELDVVGSRRETALIALRHADATTLAETVAAVLQERQPGPGQPPGAKAAVAGGQLRAFKITPDERTNTLIVSAAPEQLRSIRELVERLDVPLPPGTGRINVYYLKHANAEDMLPVLLDVLGAGGASAGSIRAGQPAVPGASYRGDRRGTGSSLRRTSRERLQRGVAPVAQPGQPAQPGMDFASDVRITADPATNALIISAVPEDYRTLVAVIERLDIRRRQVYVEAIILEVTLDRMRQLGIETQGGLRLTDDSTGLGRVSLGNLNSALANPASLSGLVLAALSDRTIELPDGTRVPAQVALLTALQNESDVNILSAPNILTTDNEEAEIIVGQNVPFVASRSTSETNLSNVFATIEREDVGITLRLTPQISEGATVRLALFEEVSAIVPNVLLDANVVGPTTTVRSASTVITVKDGQTVVIGGLISDAITSRQRKVPFLSDVPVLGNLFTNTDTSKNKINLLIFLTPHIIKDEYDAADVARAERDRFRTFMQESGTPTRDPDPLDMPSFDVPAPPRRPDPAVGLGPDGATAPATGDAATGPALALADVRVDRRDDGAAITLDVGATPTRVAHYALEEPGRFVLDVYGASRPHGTVDVVRLRDPLVRSVRVAHHTGRMRLVLDLATAVPPAYAVATDGATIVLTLGTARPPQAPDAAES